MGGEPRQETPFDSKVCGLDGKSRRGVKKSKSLRVLVQKYMESRLPAFIQVMLIRLDYLHRNNLRLLDTLYCEDALFILLLYMTNPRVRFVNCDVYRYTENQNQMSHERDPQMMQIAVKSYMTFLECLVKFSDECMENEGKLHASLKEIIKAQLFPFVSRALCANIKRSV